MIARKAFPAALVLALLPCWPALGEETAAEPTPEQAKAKMILEQANEATKKITAVRFEGSMEPSGLATNFVSASKGHGIMDGWAADLRLPSRFYATVETTRQGTDEKVRFEGGGDGDTYYLIDHGTKKGYEDMDPGVFGTAGNSLRSVGLAEYVHDAPFDQELASELTYEGEEKVGEVPCHKINVVYAGGRGTSTWYFSAEDHLPRRRVQHFDLPQGKGAIDIRITALEVSPEIDSALFKLTLPEGYEQIDDFAP